MSILHVALQNNIRAFSSGIGNPIAGSEAGQPIHPLLDSYIYNKV